jgi:anti-sigma factor RsiW
MPIPAAPRCLSPGEITPDQLMAYVDGDAPEPVVAHVRCCPACAAAAADLAWVQLRLRHAFARATCPGPETLGEYELDLLPPERRERIARHVRTCARCDADLRLLRAFLAPPT